MERSTHFGRCITLCSQHFGGAWSNVGQENLDQIVKPISGGLSNFLYVCRLPESIRSVNGEPRQVLVRFYGVSCGNPDAILKDSLVFALLAERGLGPRFYGCFSGGRFEEYIPTRCLKTHELWSDAAMRQIAQKLAKMHLLDMPLSKEPVMLKEKFKLWHGEATKNSAILMEKNPKIWMEFESMNLRTEMQTLLKWLYNSGSQVNFCHNDLQEGNILIGPQPGEFVIIDYEYAAYNFRAFDFANHFCEWCYNYTYTQPPFFTEELQHYPTDQQQREFFRHYLSVTRSTLENIEEEVQSMKEETDLFILASHFFWAMWSFVSACTSEIEFGYMEYGIARLRSYFIHKEKLLQKYPSLKESIHVAG